MSRGYSGTTDKSIVDASPISGDAFTFSAWAAYDTDNNAGQVCVALVNQTSNTNQAFLNCSFDVSATVNFSIRRSGTYYHAYTANSVTANGGWNHLAGVMVGVSERYSYLNGDTANKGTNTTTISSLSGLFNRTNVGSLYYVTTNQQTTQGRVAHPAIWNAALSDAEIVMLSQGVSPLLVRPQNLVFYVPYLGRDSSDIDIIGRNALTNTGTTSELSEPVVTGATNKNSTKIFLPLNTGSVDFSAGSTAMARVASAVVSSFPVSMFAFCKPYSVPLPNIPPGADRQFGILCVDNSATNTNFLRINLANSDFGSGFTGYSAGDILGLARVRNSGTVTATVTSNSSFVSVNQWCSIGGTFNTTPSTPTIKAYKDGADLSFPLQTNTIAFPSLDETLIGREGIATGQNNRNFDGLVSRVAIWSTVLSDAEMTSLYNGTSPLSIQLSSLVCYWPGSVITIDGSQYMEEVIQGKHALLSGGAVWDAENPSISTFKSYFIVNVNSIV